MGWARGHGLGLSSQMGSGEESGKPLQAFSGNIAPGAPPLLHVRTEVFFVLSSELFSYLLIITTSFLTLFVVGTRELLVYIDRRMLLAGPYMSCRFPVCFLMQLQLQLLLVLFLEGRWDICGLEDG